MKHSTIFQGLYYAIAEMTEEEIVSTIGSFTYREKIKEIRCIFAKQGEKAANEKGKELPAITFSASYRGKHTKVSLIKYLGHIVIDIDRLSKEELTRILPVVERCDYTRIAFISPKGMGVKIIVCACHPDETLPETLQEMEDLHHAAYTRLVSLCTELCRVEIDTSGRDVARVCLSSYDPKIYFNPNADAFLVDQPQASYKVLNRKNLSNSKQQTPPDGTPTNEDTALNAHSANASLVLTLVYYHNKSERYIADNRNGYLHHLPCTFNRYDIPQEETSASIKSQFTDFPADETVSLINSACTHTDEFNTCKLNDTQGRILRIEQYISEHYETRYSEVLHIMEYRRRRPDTEEPRPFRILDEMMENSIWIEINELGYPYTVKTVEDLIYSDLNQSYHPTREYFELLPEWDGTDYIRILADSAQTSHQEFWAECLGRYLVVVCAAATQESIVNHTVLLLCSEIQNIGKTTFISSLLPPELRAYLLTGLINSNNKGGLAKITQAMLIDLDEFEGTNSRKLNAFKDLITRKVISSCLPYARRSRNFPHTTSFAGACNYQEVLHDTTGNRRLLCFHPYSIQFITVNYAQLCAQIKYLLNKSGYQCWFTQADNERLEENSEAFIFRSPEEKVVPTHIRKPERFEKAYYLTVGKIAELIRERTSYQYSIGSKIQLGKVITKHHFESKKGNNRRRYAAFIIDIEQIKSNGLYEWKRENLVNIAKCRVTLTDTLYLLFLQGH